MYIYITIHRPVVGHQAAKELCKSHIIVQVYCCTVTGHQSCVLFKSIDYIF